MRPFFVLRQILMDDLTLGMYCRKKRLVEWTRIRERMIANERRICPQIPDHFYTAAAENYLEKNEITSLKTLVEKGFYLLAERYLEWKGEKIYVRGGAYMEWQNLLTFCPPLVLLSALIAEKYPFQDVVGSAKVNIDDYIRLNAHCTALVAPTISYLEKIKDDKGLNDLHLHVNIVMESDQVWLKILKEPRALCEVYKERTALDQTYLEQERLSGELVKLYFLIAQARALRYYIVEKYLLCLKNDLVYPNYDFQIENYDTLLGENEHPLRKNVSGECSDMELEMLLFTNVFRRMKDKMQPPEDDFVKAFYHYLLIYGSINRLNIQQVNQKGFLQFQKVVHLLRKPKSEYGNIFLQLRGNDPSVSNIRIVEARFTAKTVKNIVETVERINQGWRTCKNLDFLNLRLVVHFLKANKGEAQTGKRQGTLRHLIWKQSQYVKQAIEFIADKTDKITNISGVDAAGSEFNASPEVFGPAYRFLRRVNIPHFTYHVGEDFNHILSGLRHIYETVDFLQLKEGDRIGHAVALGVEPEVWKMKLGGYLCMSQGEWLDNLIFVYYLREEILTTNGLNAVGPGLDEEILKYAAIVYNGTYTLGDLVLAWRARKWNPDLFLSVDYEDAQQFDFDLDEWKAIQIEKKQLSPEVIELVRLYHTVECRKRYDSKCIYFEECEKVLGTKEIESLQDILLQIIIQQGIVIEVLPTSNLRIGVYKSYDELHIKRWLMKYPDLQIVVGSDDPGVFATNIYNEYAHIYTILQTEADETKCNAIIQRLHDNSLKYAF